MVKKDFPSYFQKQNGKKLFGFKKKLINKNSYVELGEVFMLKLKSC